MQKNTNNSPLSLKLDVDVNSLRMLLKCLKGYHDTTQSQLDQLREFADSSNANTYNISEAFTDLVDDLRQTCSILLQIGEAAHTKLEFLNSTDYPSNAKQEDGKAQ